MSLNSSLRPLLFHCGDSTGGFLAFVAFVASRVVLVHPLCVSVLFLGLQRWRRSFKTASHSDHFTYHMAAMEMSVLAAFVVYFCGILTGRPMVMHVSFVISMVVLPGQLLFHAVTCVERYLAVVHPVTYLGLRQRGGVRIRNACIGCVWLMSFSWCGVAEYYAPDLPIIPFFCFLFFIWFVTSLCSAAVLCVLIRPSPGEVGGDRERVSESKRKAFYTVAVILAVLWFWFVGLSVCIVLDESTLFSYGVGCVLLTAGFMFSMPGSLVLPLLFLHRAGKLRCRGPTTEAGRGSD